MTTSGTKPNPSNSAKTAARSNAMCGVVTLVISLGAFDLGHLDIRIQNLGISELQRYRSCRWPIPWQFVLTPTRCKPSRLQDRHQFKFDATIFEIGIVFCSNLCDPYPNAWRLADTIMTSSWDFPSWPREGHSKFYSWTKRV